MMYNPAHFLPVELIQQCFQQHGVNLAEGLSNDQVEAMRIGMLDGSCTPTTPDEALCLLDATGETGWTSAQA